MSSDDPADAKDNDNEALSVWAVYDHPVDFPDVFVARRHFYLLGSGRTEPDSYVITSPYLDSIRAAMQKLGLVRLERMPNDDPKIIETWI